MRVMSGGGEAARHLAARSFHGSLRSRTNASHGKVTLRMAYQSPPSLRDPMPDKKDPNSKRTHSLADHAYGADYDHSHDDGDGSDHDHDHDHFENDGALEDNPIWIQDHVTLTSVGIDIGSAGTQVIFS